MNSTSRSIPSGRIPKVRVARPAGRPYQLRYTCPKEKREIRISTGTRDEGEADLQKRRLEAELLLGLAKSKRPRSDYGPQMPWEEFREQYRTLQLITIGEKSAQDAESRLDIATEILRPRSLEDVSEPDALARLQVALLAGKGGRNGKSRSPHTVRSYLASILAALNWAFEQRWLKEKPRFKKLKVGKLKWMKGRPITEDEFSQMLEQIPAVVGEVAAESWNYLLRGLWESALRLDELMHVSWDDRNMICPVWQEGRHPVLRIPQAMQKNATEEAIPLLPGFETLLDETAESDRKGWVFNPQSLQSRLGRRVMHNRPSTDWVGKTLSKIGKKANVIVVPADEKSERAAKYASAHDLRRSCADRMLTAQVPEKVICRVLRHANWETTRRHYAPGDVDRDAQILREVLSPKENQVQKINASQGT